MNKLNVAHALSQTAGKIGSGCMTIPSFTFFVLLLYGFTSSAQGEEYKQIRLGGFSPDGEKLVLSYCTDRPTCKFGYLDIRSRKFLEVIPLDQDQIWSPGGFSPDGQQIAVSVRRKSENEHSAQLAIFDLRTQRLKELTSTPSYKSSPSFSHDGKKIIFAQSNRERQSGKTRFSDWDIYEVGTEGMNERRLTEFRFFSVTPPAYFGNDQRFIFSGDGPHNYSSPTGETGYKAYQAKFRDNDVFVLPISGEQRLIPFLTNGEMSSLPSVSASGDKIVYTARTDKLDGIKTRFTYDLFLFDGKDHRRVTRLNSLITDAVLSPNGAIVALVGQPHRKPTILEPQLLDVKSGQIDMFDPGQIGNKRSSD